MTRRRIIDTVAPLFAGFQSSTMDAICIGSLMLSVVIVVGAAAAVWG